MLERRQHALRHLAVHLVAFALDDGLGPALADLARRSPLPVGVEGPPEGLPPEIETAAYYVVLEAVAIAAIGMVLQAKIPTLALNGEKDVQVPFKQNLPAIEAALKAGGNTDGTFRSFPNLNHLFQTSKTGLPNEYAQIEETMAPVVLEAIADWILARGK